MAVLWVSIGCLVVLLVGYAVGRRWGVYKGRQQGRAEAVFQLREKGMSQGVCPICDRRQSNIR